MVSVNPKIFKAYDVRGEWGKDWDASVAYKTGRAIAFLLKPKVVAIGRDMRASSDEIFLQLSSAFCAAGIDVIDLGLCGTELTYYASSYLETVDLAIMITASHNPGQDNGLKISSKGSLSLGLDSGLSAIRDLVVSGKVFDDGDVFGKVTAVNLWEDYKKHVFNLANVDLSSLSGKKIVIDAGNGIGGYQFDRTLSDIPLVPVRLFWEPDGTFPNHPADPFLEKTLSLLKKKVVE